MRWSVVFWAIASSAALLADDQRAIEIGDRRELFVDEFLLDRLDGVELRLHSPTPREVVTVCDAAWEGSGCGYETVFRDGPIIRLFVTKPLTFRGKELSLNFATSAAGHLRVELQDPDGHPLPGFGLADSDELFGDTLQRAVTWQNKSDVSVLAGRPIRVRMALRDADIYPLRFEP